MEKALSVTHRLELALRLIDTTSGRNISSAGASVSVDGVPVPFGRKEGGLLVFQNLGKRRFHMRTTPLGWEPLEMEVDLDALPKGLPLLELHLIPRENQAGGAEFLSLEGCLPGIESLAAVRAGENACLIREFDARRRKMKIFNPHHLELDRVHYGLTDPDRGVWEPFRVVSMPDEQTLKTDRVLEMPFKNYFPVSPAVQGRTDGEGRYCLRLRDEGVEARWIVRWSVGGEARFRTVDFREEARPRLEEGGRSP